MNNWLDEVAANWLQNHWFLLAYLWFEAFIDSSLLHEKAETFFSDTESTFFVRHSSEYETSDNDRKVSRNIYQMRIDSRDRRILRPIGRKVWPMDAYSFIV